MVANYQSEREAPDSGPCWFIPSSEEDLRRFIQDVHHVFVIEDLAAMVAEGTSAYQVVLESWYDVPASY